MWQGVLQSFEARVVGWWLKMDHWWTCWLKVSKMYLASSELMPGLPSGFVNSSALLGGNNLCARCLVRQGTTSFLKITDLAFIDSIDSIDFKACDQNQTRHCHQCGSSRLLPTFSSWNSAYLLAVRAFVSPGWWWWRPDLRENVQGAVCTACCFLSGM